MSFDIAHFVGMWEPSFETLNFAVVAHADLRGFVTATGSKLLWPSS